MNVTQEQSIRPWGGITCVFSFGDCFQLPPVGMKGIHNLKPANDPSGSDGIGRLVFENYLHINEDSGTKSLVVPIDEVVRQQDWVFLNVIDAMRNGKCKTGILISC
eukprot:9211084-Ditylum_brightwellii.AAC.1